MKNTGKIGTLLVTATVAATAGFIAMLSFGSDWRAYTVQGGSMQPVYDQGDLIITSAARADSVKPGQIIVFVADWASEKYEQRVVHRVAAVGDIDGLPIAYTRGDANSIADPQPVNLASGVRVVRFSLPAGGLLLELLAGPITIAVLVTLGAGAAGAALSTGLPLFGPALRRLRPAQQRRQAQTAPATDLPFPY